MLLHILAFSIGKKDDLHLCVKSQAFHSSFLKFMDCITY